MRCYKVHFICSVFIDFQNDIQTEALIRQYNGVCTDACIAAQSAADADTNCANAALDDVTAVCSGTCRTLTDAIINACSVVRLQCI